MAATFEVPPLAGDIERVTVPCPADVRLAEIVEVLARNGLVAVSGRSSALVVGPRTCLAAFPFEVAA